MEMLYGGERLGGARKFLEDVKKAAEYYNQLSRHPGLNPEEIGRIYGAYWKAIDPEDEEKREKARAALERVIEKRIKRKGYAWQEYERRAEKIKEDNLRQGWIDGWAKVGIPREAAAQIFDKIQFGEDRMGEKRITAGAAIAALAAEEEKKKTEWALYIQLARRSGKSQYLREYMNEMEKICRENGWPYQVRMEGKGLICVRGGPEKGGMQDVAGMAKERMEKRYKQNDPYLKEETATKTTENR